ncbi:MAG: helix-turn-helix domain-containing protein [Lachnospiraceae bacterium]|nr:helix-turn-helix domain-containing protein [Lachnospiraceae bacterium]
MTIGNRILELLEERNMSQRELAEKVGVTEVSMSRYINSRRIPRAAVLSNIAKVFHVSTDYLLGIEKPESREEGYIELKSTLMQNLPKLTWKQKKNLIHAILEESEEN